MRVARVMPQPGLASYHWRLLLGMFAQPGAYWLLAAVGSAVAACVGLTINLASEATYTTETVTPLLGAFFTAFCLMPEYQGRSLELVAYRTGFFTRVVLVRALVVMLAALAIVGLTLSSLSAFLTVTGLAGDLLAAFPSVWALSLLSLTLATRFRSAWIGFAAAAAVWGLNVVLGHGVHPLLGLQGYYAAQNLEFSGNLWLLGKVCLLVVGFLLFKLHSTYAARGSRSRPEPLRAAATIGAILALYTVSGACLVVAMAWLDQPTNESSLAWLRGRMRALEVTGIPRMFGPSFLAYVAEGAGEPTGELEIRARVQQLDDAVAHGPHSVWAPRMLHEKGRLLERLDYAAGAQTYLELADRYPRTFIAQKGLEEIIRREPPAGRERGAYVRSYGTPEGFQAARKILEQYPGSDSASLAQEFLEAHYE